MRTKTFTIEIFNFSKLICRKKIMENENKKNCKRGITLGEEVKAAINCIRRRTNPKNRVEDLAVEFMDTLAGLASESL